jgi:hypothetical protein
LIYHPSFDNLGYFGFDRTRLWKQEKYSYKKIEVTA